MTTIENTIEELNLVDTLTDLLGATGERKFNDLGHFTSSSVDVSFNEPTGEYIAKILLKDCISFNLVELKSRMEASKVSLGEILHVGHLEGTMRIMFVLRKGN
jgi:hypothetical protein